MDVSPGSDGVGCIGRAGRGRRPLGLLGKRLHTRCATLRRGCYALVRPATLRHALPASLPGNIPKCVDGAARSTLARGAATGCWGMHDSRVDRCEEGGALGLICGCRGRGFEFPISARRKGESGRFFFLCYYYFRLFSI